MPATPTHHTATSDGAWDGGAAEKALKLPQDKSAAIKVGDDEYAWRDADADPTTKTAWTFPHHEVSTGGTPGAANVKACSSVCGILNGGMGGAKIPESDRQAVYDHVVAHMKDAKVDNIPPLRSTDQGGETREVSPITPVDSTDVTADPNAAAAAGELALYHPIPYRVDEDEPVTCPHCQLKNDTDATYCDQCGTQLAGRDDVTVGGVAVNEPYAPEVYDPEPDESVQCPDCQKRNDPDAKFCDQCGLDMVGRPDVNTDGPYEDVDNVGDGVQMDAAEQAESAAAEPDAAVENVNDDSHRSRPRRRAERAPRESLIRKVEFRAEPSDGLTLEGYAAVFNQPAMIESWEGTFRENMVPGAFAKTVSERTPVLMFDHGQHPMVGSIPIGTIQTIREDPHGLYVKARLADNWLVEPVRDAIKGGAIAGMSIRMSVIKDAWTVGDDRIPERSVKEVALFELGPVVFPAYEGTSVSARSRDLLTALADPEVRAELARIFASGTDLSAAEEDEPVMADHSARVNQLRRRARAALIL